jgi:hypothetical protein
MFVLVILYPPKKFDYLRPIDDSPAVISAPDTNT